jgi:hypothetical protein
VRLDTPPMRLVTADKSISAQAFSRSLELFLSLLLFVATAVQHGNSYELAAANLISITLCLGPLLILFKQPDRAGKAGLYIAEVAASVDSSLRIAFAVIAAILSAHASAAPPWSCNRSSHRQKRRRRRRRQRRRRQRTRLRRGGSTCQSVGAMA